LNKNREEMDFCGEYIFFYLPKGRISNIKEKNWIMFGLFKEMIIRKK